MKILKRISFVIVEVYTKCLQILLLQLLNALNNNNPYLEHDTKRT